MTLLAVVALILAIWAAASVLLGAVWCLAILAGERARARAARTNRGNQQ